MNPHYDVLIIGAGLSGIGMACRLASECPDKRFAILERRQAIGGTWDLFRYPGIRSDTDMCCFGFEFRPWDGLKVMGDGPIIREYVMDTAREYGVDRKRSEEHTSELQSLMRISYAVFCLKKKNNKKQQKI